MSDTYSDLAARFGGKAVDDAGGMLEAAGKWASETFGPSGNLRGSAIGGVMQGMADPVVGAVQMAANVGGDKNPLRDSVNAAVQLKEAEYEKARKAADRSGFDAARLAGNLAAPSNVALASRIPAASGTIARVGAGAAAGAVGAAATPEVDVNDYWGKTAQKAAVGGAVGGVVAPLTGAIGDKIGRMFSGSGSPPGSLPPITGAPGTHWADADIARAAAEAGQRVDDISPSVLHQLRAQAQHALSQDQTIDTQAALRKADFDSLGVPPTLGQVTRNPMQFAREKNLRGVEGVGEPLQERMSGQTASLKKSVDQFAENADETFGAGQSLASSLGRFDASAKAVIDDAYEAARDTAGRYVDLDHVAFVKAANDALDEGQLGKVLRKHPARSILNDVALGRTPLNVNTAVQIDSTLSGLSRDAMQRGDRETAKAIGKIRTALNNAEPVSDMGADSMAAFRRAREMARERFALHEAIPALKAAADGDVPADDFVRRFVLNGDALELRRTASLLKRHDPAVYAQVRAQIGEDLRRAGFGENVTGDKTFSQERFNKKLRSFGSARLQAFFSPEEISQLRTIGRVGAYMESPPAGSAVNYSNSGSAVANLARGFLPGAVGRVADVAGVAARNARGVADVRAAMRAEVPRSGVPRAEQAANRNINELLLLGSAGAGAGTVRQ